MSFLEKGIRPFWWELGVDFEVGTCIAAFKGTVQHFGEINWPFLLGQEDHLPSGILQLLLGHS